MSGYRRLLFPAAFLGTTFGSLYFALTRHIRSEQIRPYGCCTAQQVLDRAESLCHRLVPQTGSLRLAAWHSTREAPYPTWNVTCSDLAGNDLLYFTWNATTGQLCCVGNATQQPAQHIGKPLTSREAVEVTWRWLQVLGSAGQALHWHLVSAPSRSSEICTVFWQADRLRAVVRVDCRTRELLVFRCFQTSAAH